MSTIKKMELELVVSEEDWIITKDEEMNEDCVQASSCYLRRLLKTRMVFNINLTHIEVPIKYLYPIVNFSYYQHEMSSHIYSFDFIHKRIFDFYFCVVLKELIQLEEKMIEKKIRLRYNFPDLKIPLPYLLIKDNHHTYKHIHHKKYTDLVDCLLIKQIQL